MDCSKLEDQYAVATLPGGARLPLTLVKGDGCYVFDDQGNRYLDLYGGHAVCLIGYGHPRWVQALSQQAQEFAFYSTITAHPARAEAARLLVENSYPSMRKVFFCNSGAEANETAIKLARKASGRSVVIAMEKGFHGRTVGALSVTGNPGFHAAFKDNLVDRTRFVPFGDLAAVRSIPPQDVAAVLLEPIQSVAGVYTAPVDYYRALREYCSAHDIALIFDEVQTGNGRTGKWFIGEHWGVEPDIVSTAKGLGGGFPVGAVIINESLAGTIRPADHASTFGGGPMASACVVATHRILSEEGLLDRVARLSTSVVERLRGLVGGGLVRDVRGLGYLLGVECELPTKEVLPALRGKGILVGGSGNPHTFRLLPPLTLEEPHWDEFFEALESISPGA